MRGVAWNKQRIGLLKTLWAEGRPAAEIAARLRISRAAVLGKVFRLRLKPAANVAPAPMRGDAGSPGSRRRGRRYPDKPVAPVAPIVPVTPAKARGKSLLELTNDTCRWLGN